MINPVRRIINPVHRIEWKLIPPLNDGILPYYYISNTGLLYNIRLNRYVAFNPTYDGYISVRLQTINGGITRRVHRLVMMTFNPIDNCELYEVNHIDGVKTNNQLWNLEWVTHDQNMKHASRTGLFVTKGENRDNTKLTIDQVRSICEKISDGKSPTQIANEMNIKDCSIEKIVMNIIGGYSWKHISKDYDFSNAYKKPSIFTDEQIHLICKYFEQNGNNASSREILNYLGITPKDYKDFRNYGTAITSIRKKKYYKDICNQYNY